MHSPLVKKKRPLDSSVTVKVIFEPWMEWYKEFSNLHAHFSANYTWLIGNLNNKSSVL